MPEHQKLKEARYTKEKTKILECISELSVSVSNGKLFIKPISEKFLGYFQEIAWVPGSELSFPPKKFNFDNEVQQAWKDKYAELLKKADELKEKLSQSIREQKQKQFELKLNKSIKEIEKIFISLKKAELALLGSTDSTVESIKQVIEKTEVGCEEEDEEEEEEEDEEEDEEEEEEEDDDD
jgi:hypothetical protein